MITEPVFIQPNIRYAGDSFDQCLDGSPLAARVHVEVERLFPHRSKKDSMARLSGVFLRDLKLNRFVRLFECAKQGRYRLPHLKIDRAVLNLNKSVVLELAVQ